MPRTDWGWLITAEELRSWILFEDERLLVVNKPAHVVCHPSKHGEWSSLIGAARAYLGPGASLHMPSRLDRETSGVMVIVKDTATRQALHRAALAGEIGKTYHAVLAGRLVAPITVEQPIGLASSQVAARRAVRPDGQPALTEFIPLAWENGYTLARIVPRTGRTHQIRVHAAWLGHPVAGDKLYPDESVFLAFLATGRAPGAALGRQALHASRWSCASRELTLAFEAPLPVDEWRSLMPELSATS